VHGDPSPRNDYAALDRIVLGAPGIYTLPAEPIRQLTGERMDVCAFVGVAPRGPCRVPVVDETSGGTPTTGACVIPLVPAIAALAAAVESFDGLPASVRGFDGPGLLPYAVASFFEQGGRRAYIVRVVHEYQRYRSQC